MSSLLGCDGWFDSPIAINSITVSMTASEDSTRTDTDPASEYHGTTTYSMSGTFSKTYTRIPYTPGTSYDPDNTGGVLPGDGECYVIGKCCCGGFRFTVIGPTGAQSLRVSGLFAVEITGHDGRSTAVFGFADVGFVFPDDTDAKIFCNNDAETDRIGELVTMSPEIPTATTTGSFVTASPIDWTYSDPTKSNGGSGFLDNWAFQPSSPPVTPDNGTMTSGIDPSSISLTASSTFSGTEHEDVPPSYTRDQSTFASLSVSVIVA